MATWSRSGDRPRLWKDTHIDRSIIARPHEWGQLLWDDYSSQPRYNIYRLLKFDGEAIRSLTIHHKSASIGQFLRTSYRTPRHKTCWLIEAHPWSNIPRPLPTYQDRSAAYNWPLRQDVGSLADHYRSYSTELSSKNSSILIKEKRSTSSLYNIGLF